MTAYLDMGQLVAAARAALGSEPKVSNRRALLRCVAEPAAAAGGVEIYPELADKAAALMIAVARTHRPFADGNRRASFVAAALLLNVNGHRLAMPLPDASALIDKVALGELTEAREVATRMTPHIMPV
ncbi:MAG: type II toxin-antitoxin system death-on-curing family toxin [Thermoanaerobaculia bacterium]